MSPDTYILLPSAPEIYIVRISLRLSIPNVDSVKRLGPSL